MPSGGGENNYMRLLVVSRCWGFCKPNDIVKKIENTLTQQQQQKQYLANNVFRNTPTWSSH